jgi:hypothetical protein
MGYDVRILVPDLTSYREELHYWRCTMSDMGDLRWLMSRAEMIVPPYETPADYDIMYDRDSGAPGIPGYKLQYTDGHIVVARELQAALSAYDARFNTDRAALHALRRLLRSYRVPKEHEWAEDLMSHARGAATYPSSRWRDWIAFLRRGADTGIVVM